LLKEITPFQDIALPQSELETPGVASESQPHIPIGGNKMNRTAQAHWQGDLKTGTGSLTAPSGVLSNTPYSFHTRFESTPGTNPEELVAAAHAGCFTMALSAELGKAGLTAESLDTTCTITLEEKDGGFSVSASHLELKAKIPGATEEAFKTAADAAKSGCPISKLYNTNITLTATLG
jgi:lipoyl-dependent peroxiredoxin